MPLDASHILDALRKTGAIFNWPTPVEILLIGGAAGMITGLLPTSRVTLDCDVIHYAPAEAANAVEEAAAMVAAEIGMPSNWLNSQARQLNILPDGWRNRRVHVGDFGQLCVYSIGRLDLLAMKFYANRAHDREDILAMRPQAHELLFVKTYLQMLRVPSRQANLDQVESALRLLDAVGRANGQSR